MHNPPEMTYALKGLRMLGQAFWLPFGIRDRIIRRFSPPDVSKPSHFSTPYYGLRYDGSLDNFIDWSVWFYGAYSKYELDCIADLAGSSAEPWTCLDVGANVGTHTLFLSRIAKHVHAFEPWLPVRRKMLHAVEANGIVNVTVHPVGLADQNARLPFLIPTGRNLGTGEFVNRCRSSLPSAELEVVRGDEYLRTHNVGPVGFIKIDVEGFETQVLKGLQHTIWTHRPIILMELSERTRSTLKNDAWFRALVPHHYTREYLVMNSWAGYRRIPFVWNRPLSESLLLYPHPAMAKSRRVGIQ